MPVVVNRIFALLLCAALAGCTAPPPPAIYRDTSAQIASQTDVTVARMAGDWSIRQRFDAPFTPLTTLSFAGAGNGALTLSADGAAPVILQPTGPGRWSTDTHTLWVLWMDFDTRTAAIGTPSGDFGWIMDKTTTGGADRIAAARDIMAWFGFDIGRLQRVAP